MKKQINEIRRMQQLAGVIKENNPKLPGKFIDAASSAKRALEILRSSAVVGSQDQMRNTFDSAIMMLDALLNPGEDYVHEDLNKNKSLLNFIEQNKEEVINAFKTQTDNDHLIDLIDFHIDNKGAAAVVGIFNVGTEKEPDEMEGGISFIDVTGRSEGKNTIKVGDKIIKYIKYDI